LEFPRQAPSGLPSEFVVPPSHTKLNFSRQADTSLPDLFVPASPGTITSTSFASTSTTSSLAMNNNYTLNIMQFTNRLLVALLFVLVSTSFAFAQGSEVATSTQTENAVRMYEANIYPASFCGVDDGVVSFEVGSNRNINLSLKATVNGIPRTFPAAGITDGLITFSGLPAGTYERITLVDPISERGVGRFSDALWIDAPCSAPAADEVMAPSDEELAAEAAQATPITPEPLTKSPVSLVGELTEEFATDLHWSAIEGFATAGEPGLTAGFYGGNNVYYGTDKYVAVSWKTEVGRQFLNGWADWNANGVFEKDERIIENYEVSESG